MTSLAIYLASESDDPEVVNFTRKPSSIFSTPSLNHLICILSALVSPISSRYSSVIRSPPVSPDSHYVAHTLCPGSSSLPLHDRCISMSTIPRIQHILPLISTLHGKVYKQRRNQIRQSCRPCDNTTRREKKSKRDMDNLSHPDFQASPPYPTFGLSSGRPSGNKFCQIVNQSRGLFPNWPNPLWWERKPVLKSNTSEGARDAVSSIQTYSSGVPEMDSIRVFDAPPLIHPVDSVAGGAGRIGSMWRKNTGMWHEGVVRIGL